MGGLNGVLRANLAEYIATAAGGHMSQRITAQITSTKIGYGALASERLLLHRVSGSSPNDATRACLSALVPRVCRHAHWVRV